MMKKFFISTSAIVMSMAMAFSSYALPMTSEEAAQALVTADADFFYKSGSDIRFTLYDDQADMDIDNAEYAVTSTFRGCDITEIGNLTYYRKDANTGSVRITSSQLSILAEHQDYVDSWADSIARSIFPSGTDRDTVLKNSYLHLARNYYYKLPDSEEEIRQAQGAYYLATKGYGICASETKAFRSIVEAVPFNPATGLVDWECASPTRIKVAIVWTNTHEWAEVQDDDGVWYIYDLAISGKSLESLKYFHRTHEEIVALGHGSHYGNFVNARYSY